MVCPRLINCVKKHSENSVALPTMRKTLKNVFQHIYIVLNIIKLAYNIQIYKAMLLIEK